MRFGSLKEAKRVMPKQSLSSIEAKLKKLALKDKDNIKTLEGKLKKTSTREEELRLRNYSLLRQLDKVKNKSIEIKEVFYKACQEATSALDIPIVDPPKKDTRTVRESEVAVALVSDWQLGKRTPTYNTDVCEQRVMLYADKVAEITNIQRADHPIRECRVYLLGDMVEGELIFPGQAHQIDASLFRQVCVDGPRILVRMLRKLLATFDKIHVVCVIGNHGAIAGRMRREMHPESNSDLMLYTIVKMMFEEIGEKRISFQIPFTRGERSWYATDDVGSFRFFLAHGDQMRGGGFGGLPHYGFARAINNWASGVIPEGFHAAVMGHWHQAASIPFNHRILWINGSTEDSNNWLREELKVQCPPSQWLLFCHPRRGVTSEHRVWLSSEGAFRA